MDQDEAGRMNRQRHRRQRIAAAGLIAFVALSIVGLRLYIRRQETVITYGGYVPKKEKITPDVVRLQQYVRIDTTNPPGREIEGARWLARQLSSRGVPAEIIETAPGRANVYARLRGRQPGEGLLLLHHIDVVPADPGAWSLPPFAGAIQLNMLYGRGAIDMKGIAICQMEAFLAIAQSKQQPERDIVFLAVADEEEGGRWGIEWLLRHRPDVVEGVAYALAEGGITEMNRERVGYFGIEIGSKQVVDVDVSAKSADDLRRLRIALEPYFAPREPDRILPGVTESFRAAAPNRVENRDLYLDVEKTIEAGKFWLLPVNYRALLQNTVWAEGIREGTPPRMRVHLLNLPDEDPAARIRWLDQIARDANARVAEVLRREGPVPVSSFVSPLFRLIAREASRQYGGVPAGPQLLARSTSDCRFLRVRGVQCYGVQPFLIDFHQSSAIHGVDERVRLDWFQDGVGLMKRIVAAWAQGQ